MFSSRTQHDLINIDRCSDRSSFAQADSVLNEATHSSRQNRSACSVTSTLHSKVLEWRDRLFSSHKELASNAPLSASPNSVTTLTLPDSSLLATAANNTTAFNINTQQIAGTLRADTFAVSPYVTRTVISGNGNVDFGRGYRDLLDLSGVSYNSLTFNWASQTGGVVYNPGNGNRVFDAINFSNGRQILFEGIDSIRFAEGSLNLSVTPNDPLFSQQWNLHMIGVHNAWRFTQGSSNVLIGIEDTGLSIDNSGTFHVELQSTIILGKQVIDDTRTNHGTSVQGIIAATSNNGIGMSGINWNSNVFNIDVLNGEPGDLSVANAAQAIINQARQNSQRLVINLSLGVEKSFGRNYDSAFEQVVNNNPDVLFVIAAGNDGSLGREGLASPAFLAQSKSNVMAVGAVWGTQAVDGTATVPGTRIQYNGGWGSQYGAGLTVVAPSEVIAPIVNNSTGAFTAKFNGTSAAAPTVTGVASLVLSANPDLSASQVRQILAQTAFDVGQRGYDTMTGSGVVNADAAVRRAMAIARGYA